MALKKQLFNKMSQNVLKLALIDEFLPVMIQSHDNALYVTFNQKHKDISQRLDETKRAEMFKTEYVSLNEKLQTTDDLSEKINLLDRFIKRYSPFECFKTKIIELKAQRDMFIKERNFNNFEQECNALIAKRPTEFARSFELTNHRDAVKLKLGEEGLERFKGHSRYQALQKRLNDEIAYVKKTIGDGSWHDIEEKLQGYHNDPTKETKEKLENALNIFDENEFPNYSENVRITKQKLKQDWENRCAIQTTWDNLRNHPSPANWIKFKNACINSRFWRSEYGDQALVAIPNADSFSSTDDLQRYANYFRTYQLIIS